MVHLSGHAKVKRKAVKAKKAVAHTSKSIARHASGTEKSKGFYVTTAIDYTNAPPHIGHSLEKVQADVLARWHRLNGEKVFFLTGTDEHGQKNENAAAAAGITPKEFVDRMVPHFKHAWEALNLSFDRFIRTTDADHVKIAVELIKKVAKNGDIYKDSYEGLYCVGCERFYTERELDDGSCPVHKKQCEKVKEEGYFFRLSKYRQKLLDFYEQNPHFIVPEGRRNEIINRVKEGLKDVSITRANVKWGIPFPLDERYSTYVWFDALPNYITALGWPDGKLFKQFWPADVHCIGKDIAWFHCVIWPAILLSAGIEPPKTVFVHGYLTVNGEKISKSLGNVIDPTFLVQKYGADTVRYFLLREIPSTEDGDFNEKALIARNNSELADQLGNLVNRALVLCEKFTDGKVPKSGKPDGGPDVHLIADSLATQKKMETCLKELKFHDALTELWRLVARANAYVNETKPWELNGERQQTVLYNLLESVRFIAVLLEPFLPATAENILGQLGIVGQRNPNIARLASGTEKYNGQNFSTLRKFGGLKAGTKLNRGKILFNKIEANAAAAGETNETIGRHTLGGGQISETKE
ncbi:MAG: methionine--tRNA ligase, partial [Candidatus Aenigmatarchaeota archaeon]